MKSFSSPQWIRNVGIIAHIDAGKTTLTERILFETKEIRRMGEVPDGTTVTDFLPEERERGISITAAAVACCWKQWRIHVIDTPGHIDFTAEVERSLSVMDGVVVVLDAVKGVQAQTETVWRQASRYQLPAVVFGNKMDRPGADAARVVRDVTARLGIRAVPIQYPLFQNGTFVKSIPLWEEGELLRLNPDSRLEAEILREQLVEALAEVDDEVLPHFLGGTFPELQVLHRALRKGTLQRKLLPVLFGSSLQNRGVRQLLDAVGAYLPSPEAEDAQPEDSPAALRVFRVEESPRTGGRLVYARVLSGVIQAGVTVCNRRTGQVASIGEVLRIHASETEVIPQASAGEIIALSGDWGGRIRTGDMLADPSVAVSEGKLSFPQPVCSIQLWTEEHSRQQLLAAVLKEMTREDPTLRLRPGNGGAWILSGMGELHLEVIRNRLKTEYGIPTKSSCPRVEYRRTVGRHFSGGGQFEKRFPDGRRISAEVQLQVDPLAEGAGFLLGGAAVVRSLSDGQRQAVMQGIQTVVRAENSGFPLTDMKVTLLSVSAPNAETTETAYFSAARDALESVLSQADLRELEPVMKLEVLVPQDAMGGILADLSARRAEILKVDSIGSERARLGALVPLAELFGYASSLRSLSAGRGEVVAEPAKYAVRATHC